MRTDLFLLGLAALLASAGLRGGEPESAELLWQHAVEQSGGDRTHPLFIDATRELARLRPWQQGYREARERMREVGEARLRPR